MKRSLITIVAFLILSLGLIISPEAAKKNTKNAEKAVKEIEVGDKTYLVKGKGGTYYVTEEDGLNVRKLPDKESKLLGCLEYSEKVTVTGFVYETVEKKGKKKEQKTGWVEIKFQTEQNGKTKNVKAYIREELDQKNPKAVGETEKKQEEIYRDPYEDPYENPYEDSYENSYEDPYEEYAECPYCGEWYETGISYRSHVTACMDNQQQSYEQSYECPICGAWFSSIDAISAHAATCYANDFDPCPYCGEYYHHNGNAYEVHVASCGYNPAPSAYTCPSCGMLMEYSDQYSHVCGVY